MRALPRKADTVSLERRLLLTVLIGAPIVWLLALAIGLLGASREINELFDTQQVRFARQVAALLARDPPERLRQAGESLTPLPQGIASGAAELGDLSVSAWDAEGQSIFEDAVEGARLPFRRNAAGFEQLNQPRGPWRVFYQRTPESGATVAVGQWVGERDELIRDLMLGQAGPWLLMLALLLPVLYLGVRRALSPVVALARHIEGRPTDDRRPLPLAGVPQELQPLVSALNRMFDRIALAMEQERRFTADAAHELRTPLAAIRSQWEVASMTPDAAQRAEASAKVLEGIDRSARVVAQLLAMSRLDGIRSPLFEERIEWRSVIGAALSDVLDLAEGRGIAVDVEWRTPDRNTLPMVASPDLAVAALRNLLDNAVRYSPPGSTVTVVCQADAVTVLDEGPGVDDSVLPRLKERFFRAADAGSSGSGLGLSIVDRIAALLGLSLVLANRPGSGFRATLSRGPTS